MLASPVDGYLQHLDQEAIQWHHCFESAGF